MDAGPSRGRPSVQMRPDCQERRHRVVDFDDGQAPVGFLPVEIEMGSDDRGRRGRGLQELDEPLALDEGDVARPRFGDSARRADRQTTVPDQAASPSGRCSTVVTTVSLSSLKGEDENQNVAAVGAAKGTGRRPDRNDPESLRIRRAGPARRMLIHVAQSGKPSRRGVRRFKFVGWHLAAKGSGARAASAHLHPAFNAIAPGYSSVSARTSSRPRP